MKLFVLLTLFCSPFFICSSSAQAGVFHIKTGEVLNEEEWKKVPLDSLHFFDSESPFPLTIESDFKNLRKRKLEDEYQEAILEYRLNDSLLIKRNIKIKARGEFRKKICYFPPLKLNFKKSDPYAGVLKGLDKTKLVSKCKGGSLYESYVLKEYLIYKMYNLFTEKSFKARLLQVRYIDTGKKNKKMETLAFLIEEADQMAARNNAGLAKQDNLRQTSLDARQMDIVAMFCYMIGNTDYSVPRQHNLKLIKVIDFEEPKPYPVPYDFDYTGFVNANYAIPAEVLGIESVRERLYLGYCRTDEEYQATIAVFLEKEQAIYDLINNFSYLEKRDKKEMLNYIKEFYDLIRQPELAGKIFQKTCKN